MSDLKLWKELKDQNNNFFSAVVKNKEIYLLLLPGITWYIIFAYLPLHGLSLAFKTFKASRGIFGSPWVGMKNYMYVFRDPAFIESIIRTFQINVGRLIFYFPFPVILALVINEVRIGFSKRIYQTIFTFPQFLSWVIIASIFTNVLGQTGMVNSIIVMLDGKHINFLGSVPLFLPIVYLSEI
jgi:putative aldouronate transport system permease protein